jgi:hypothetical protein
MCENGITYTVQYQYETCVFSTPASLLDYTDHTIDLIKHSDIVKMQALNIIE